MAKDIPLEIGFVGGGSTGVALPETDVDNFTKQLDTGSGWYTLTSGDGGRVVLDLSKIVYVRIAPTSRSIGFSH